VASPTLANSLSPLQLFAQRQREFRVFPTGDAEYHWRIVASRTNRTVSRHKSLSFALRKCSRLNKTAPRRASHEIN
jgi:hypothetical protein